MTNEVRSTDATYDNGDDFRVIQFTPPGFRVLGYLRQERHRGGTRLRRRMYRNPRP